MSCYLLTSLCQSNKRILQQKLHLLELLERSGSPLVFNKKCALVGASIGQHLRHSMDHMELAARAAAQFSLELNAPSHPVISDLSHQQDIILQYDVRKRGADDETQTVSARERILSVYQMLDSISARDEQEQFAHQLLEKQIRVSFLMPLEEMQITSNVARELSFVVHHAVHHLALIKIIGSNLAAFGEADLPLDFGKAPSTILYEKHNTNQ